MIEKKAQGGTGGGGGGQKTTVESTRNTITCTETATGWDIDVASEDALRYLIHNFREFMEASVDIGTRYARGETTSCVMQLVDDIMMCDATLEDEELYKVNGTKLIDYENKTFKFGWFFFYTTILSDGNKRHLQLLYPDSGHIDTWQFQANRIKFDNVHIGGGIGLYNSKHGTSYDPQTVAYSRYLLASTTNLNYTISNCTIACCGANDASYNPFIQEGGSTAHQNFQYHTNIKISNCDFFHGGDSHGGMWDNLNAPIVIFSNNMYSGSHQRIVVFKQMSKNINNDATETGCPHIQFRTVALTDPSYDTQKAYWISHPWQLSTDGTALVTNTVDEACIVFEAKLALKDIYLQGNPNLQPENPSPDNNYVSLVDELLKSKTKVFDFGASNGGYTLLCIADVTTMMSGHAQKAGISGVLCALPKSAPSGSNVVLQRIIAWGNYTLYPRLWFDNDNNEGIKPYCIYYNNKYYLALERKRSESYEKVLLFGDYFGLNIDPFMLYSDSLRTTWYSDTAHTTQITITFTRNPEYFRYYFGGTNSQVMAGDGTFLNWDSKLGYWKGTQQDYDDLPAEQKDLPNVLYIIV